MVKSERISKNPKYREILRSKSSSRSKILVGGVLMSFAAIFTQSSIELTVVFALSSGCMFYWDIARQAKSGFATEQRISELEEKIEKFGNNSKSDNQ